MKLQEVEKSSFSVTKTGEEGMKWRVWEKNEEKRKREMKKEKRRDGVELRSNPSLQVYLIPKEKKKRKE